MNCHTCDIELYHCVRILTTRHVGYTEHNTSFVYCPLLTAYLLYSVTVICPVILTNHRLSDCFSDLFLSLDFLLSYL